MKELPNTLSGDPPHLEGGKSDADLPTHRPGRATVLLAASLTNVAADAAPSTDFAVTDDGAYTRHDGGTDQAIRHCGNPATSPAQDDVPNDGDVDSNDGGNRRQGNEPTVAVDPTDPNVIVAGWNDYCQTDLAAGWIGLAFSTDRGTTWTDSTLPGYPLDNSAEGRVSPLKGRTDSGDPLVAFDNDGRLFVGGIAFNRVRPQIGSVFVSTYGANPARPGSERQLPKDYLRTLIVGQKGTPAINGIFQDKPMLEVDRSTASPHEDNVYFCWSKFQGSGRTNRIYFVRSTDHGRSFSRGHIVSDGSVQGCDIAVENDGDVYVSWRTFATRATGHVDGMSVVRSSDGGRTFPKPVRIAAFTPYFPRVGGARDCGDGPFFCGGEGYVFHRVPLEPRLTADQTGTRGRDLRHVERRRPGERGAEHVVVLVRHHGHGRPLARLRREVHEQRPHLVGRGRRSTARRATRGTSTSATSTRTPAAWWRCGRTTGPTTRYSVQRPIGNRLDAQGRAVATGPDAVATYAATSTNGTSWTPLGRSRRRRTSRSSRCSAIATSRSRVTTTGSRSPTATAPPPAGCSPTWPGPTTGRSSRARTPARPRPRPASSTGSTCSSAGSTWGVGPGRSTAPSRWPGPTRRSRATTAATRAASTRTSSGSACCTDRAALVTPL